jgi:endonuclease YncB( thermonuclease family)
VRTFFPYMITLVSVGCYTPPDLPLIGEIPIIAGDECAPQRDVNVGCVLDGDTFDVTACGGGAERIRLLGINAPEIEHAPDPEECFGDEGSDELKRIISGQEVTLTFDSDCLGVFGRTLAYVWLTGDDARDLMEEDDRDSFEAPSDDGQPSVLVNRWLVEKGFARVYDEDFAPVNELRLGSDLQRAESDARSERQGLWGACEIE